MTYQFNATIIAHNYLALSSIGAYIRFNVIGDQCDQIGQFIGYWQFLKPLATINLPKSPHILRQFLLKVSKSIILLGNHFWVNFIDIWQFFPGHTVGDKKCLVPSEVMLT